MFKAIGRWGSQVKSRIRIPFLSGIFGSKSTTYAGIGDDEEEIFSDAREDLSDSEEETVAPKNTENGHVTSLGDTEAALVESFDSRTESQDAANVEFGLGTSTTKASGDNLVDLSVHKSDDSIESSHSGASSGGEHSDHEHDDHLDAHNDKKKIIKSDSKANGMAKSPSTSTFKKVHRRISSLTQKQYTKLDSNANDDADHLVHHEVEDDHVIEDDSITEINEDKRREKKPSRRKKVPVFDFFRNILRFTTRQNRTRMN